ncbi:MAG TPA: DinB family protein [Blastocatellia bacterium]|nr:DinB family protein [Blastocatellia bacterium]
MSRTDEQTLLEALLDSWDRSNTILLNLLQALPEGGLQARVMEGSPSVSEMFTHIHHERMISVFEEAPEFAGDVPEKEWMIEHDPDRIARMLGDSAKRVRDAVKSRVETGRDLNLHFDHPILLLQLLIFHEAYHHGQIKLALKVAGRPVTDDEAGPVTWDIWRRRK